MSERDIERTLGKLEADVQRLLSMAEESERRASENRARIYQKLQDGEVRFERLEARQNAFQRDMEQIKPITDVVRRWEQRGIGAAAVIAFLGAAFGSILTLWREKILSLFGGG